MIRIESYAIRKRDFPVVNKARVFRHYNPDKLYRIFKYWTDVDQVILKDIKRNTTSYYERPEF